MRRRVIKGLSVWRVGVFLALSLTTIFAAAISPTCASDASSFYNFVIEFTLENRSNWEISSVNGKIPIMAWNGLPTYQQIETVVADPAVSWNDNGYQIGFNLKRLPSHGLYRIRVKYRIHHSTLFQDPPNLPASPDYGRSMKAYLQPENGVETGNTKLVAILSSLGVDSGTPKEKARKIFAFVNDTLDYKLDPNRKADALVALQTGWGRCEDYAMLFTALCRTAGIPARLVSGLRIQPQEIGDDLSSPIDALHMWAEIYLPSIGWISVDPTYITTYNGKKITDYRSFAGFYENDIHIFLCYGQYQSQIYYQREADLATDFKYYISRAQ